MKLNRSGIKLNADASRVILLFRDSSEKREKTIINRVMTISEEKAVTILQDLRQEFAHRHSSGLEPVFLEHFMRVKKNIPNYSDLSENRKLLFGAYFTKEYSIESAALFNPSMVLHPNQDGVPDGAARFLISLRATGEGHISSIEFRAGIIDANGKISLDEFSPLAKNSEKNKVKIYEKEFIEKRSKGIKNFDKIILDILPQQFTSEQVIANFGRKISR